MPSVIEELRSFFQNHGWCQAAWSDYKGSFCLLGACGEIYKLDSFGVIKSEHYHELKKHIWEYLEANSNLQHTLNMFRPEDVSVATFNDHSSTTFETIKELLK